MAHFAPFSLTHFFAQSTCPALAPFAPHSVSVSQPVMVTWSPGFSWAEVVVERPRPRASARMASGMNLGQFLRWSIMPYFFVFYLLGYMIYVCVYAVGGAITNSEKEAQQATTPAMLIIMVPWFLLAPIIMNPESRMATVLSMIPLFTPITMFVRVLVSDPPFCQVGASIVLTVATITFLFWAAAKIFRVGILSYGKRPTIPELWRWLKVA